MSEKFPSDRFPAATAKQAINMTRGWSREQMARRLLQMQQVCDRLEMERDAARRLLEAKDAYILSIHKAKDDA